MALISQIQGTNNTIYNLRDDVHTWGGRNLALATSYDQFDLNTYDVKTKTTILNNNRVKIEAGGWFRRYGNTIANFSNAPRLFQGDFIASIYVYENTLDQDGHISCWRKTTATGGGGVGGTIPAQTTGLITINMKNENGSYYGFTLDISLSNATSGYLVVGPFKVEKGNKPTDWSPAPEDIARVNGTQLILLS